MDNKSSEAGEDGLLDGEAGRVRDDVPVAGDIGCITPGDVYMPGGGTAAYRGIGRAPTRGGSLPRQGFSRFSCRGSNRTDGSYRGRVLHKLKA
jgi:hypothetical protein